MRTYRSTLSIAAALGAIAFGAAPASAATVVVNPADMGAWTFHVNAADGVGDLVAGPDTPPLGTGSAHLDTGTPGDLTTELHNGSYDGTPLASLTALGYSSYATSSAAGHAVLALDLDLDGDGAPDDTIFFDPAYQSVAPAVASWQSWDALAGGWWSQNGVAGANPGVDVKTLADYLAVEPDAAIANPAVDAAGLRFVLGGGLAQEDGNVDAVQVADETTDTTYDFEPAPPDTDGDGVADEQDACPNSDLSETTVVLGTCDSGVTNSFLPSGCNIADLVDACYANAKNHGKAVSCVSKTTNALKKSKVITGAQKGKVQSCAARLKQAAAAAAKTKGKKN